MTWDWDHLQHLFEDEAAALLSTVDASDVAAVSAAISLKRIADMLQAGDMEAFMRTMQQNSEVVDKLADEIRAVQTYGLKLKKD